MRAPLWEGAAGARKGGKVTQQFGSLIATALAVSVGGWGLEEGGKGSSSSSGRGSDGGHFPAPAELLAFAAQLATSLRGSLCPECGILSTAMQQQQQQPPCTHLGACALLSFTAAALCRSFALVSSALPAELPPLRPCLLGLCALAGGGCAETAVAACMPALLRPHEAQLCAAVGYALTVLSLRSDVEGPVLRLAALLADPLIAASTAAAAAAASRGSCEAARPAAPPPALLALLHGALFRARLLMEDAALVSSHSLDGGHAAGVWPAVQLCATLLAAGGGAGGSCSTDAEGGLPEQLALCALLPAARLHSLVCAACFSSPDAPQPVLLLLRDALLELCSLAIAAAERLVGAGGGQAVLRHEGVDGCIVQMILDELGCGWEGGAVEARGRGRSAGALRHLSLLLDAAVQHCGFESLCAAGAGEAAAALTLAFATAVAGASGGSEHAAAVAQLEHALRIAARLAVEAAAEAAKTPSPWLKQFFANLCDALPPLCSVLIFLRSRPCGLGDAAGALLRILCASAPLQVGFSLLAWEGALEQTCRRLSVCLKGGGAEAAEAPVLGSAPLDLLVRAAGRADGDKEVASECLRCLAGASDDVRMAVERVTLSTV